MLLCICWGKFYNHKGIMRKNNFGLEFWIVYLFFCCCGLTNAEDDGKNRQTFVIRYKDGEQTIPVTVVLDYKKQTEYVINMNPRSPAKSVTLYDFKQRTIAYKDLTNQECFLGRLTHETLTEESSALRDLQSGPVEGRPKVRSLDPGRPALSPTEIRNIAGQKTAVFCRKMNTWLLMPDNIHGISKREADEFEERTYHHHGFHTVQYSHYGRETRRRYRNQVRHDSHKNQGAEEDQRLVVPESSPLPEHHRATHGSPDDFRLNSRTHHNTARSEYPNPPIHDKTRGSNKKLKGENGIESSTNDENADRSLGNINNFGYKIKYPNFEANYSSHYRYPSELTSNDNSTAGFESQVANDSLFFNREQLQENRSIENASDKSFHGRTERSTSTSNTTDVPAFSHIPQVHPSLAHLLPLYKPLSQEFDFDQAVDPEGDFDHDIGQENSQYRGIEREFDPNGPSHTQPPKHYFDTVDDHNNSDVSTNVLEIPRITNEFESIKDNKNYVDNFRGPLKYHNLDNYPFTSQAHYNDTPHLLQNNVLRLGNSNSEHSSFYPGRDITDPERKFLLEENISYIPPSEVFSTTELPTFQTSDYLPSVRLSSTLHSPSNHKTNRNEEIGSFPNYPANNHLNPLAPQNNLPMHAHRVNYFTTTEYSVQEEKFPENFNHRSNIPSEENTSRSDANAPNTQRSAANKTAGETFPPYRIRYQSVLRDFKPDEIVIDIENIPTHPPPSVTSRFQQKVLTTIQPTIRSISFGNVRSDTGRRSHQTAATTFGSYIPTTTVATSTTTRHPRRINGRTRKPSHASLSLQSEINSLHQNHHRPNRQHNRIHHVKQSHQPQHHRFHHSGPNPPSPITAPSQFNQFHHLNQLDNLPPGISVHPRHPQAPFADMVQSNRPPTMPFVKDNQPYPQSHHRQRHHRKKDRLNSCCRHREKQGSTSQPCCRNGGPCCARSHRGMQVPGQNCCSSPKVIDPVMPTNQIHPSLRASNHIPKSYRSSNHIQPLLRSANTVESPLRASNQVQPRLRTEPRNVVDDKDRCEKEKMCRTVYESTQKIMVCRNAHVEGC